MNLCQRAQLVVVLSITAAFGCTRADYRIWSDRDALALLQSRQNDPRWQIPTRPVEARMESRMADPNPAECGPLPIDDPSAECWMYRPGGKFRAWKGWSKYGVSPIENEHWEELLPRDEDGVVVISRKTATELALLHSRDYQTEVESLYFSSLGLSLERYEFNCRWFGGTNNTFTINGNGQPPFGSRTLVQSNSLGFSRALPAGGQLLVDFANTFVWEFAGGDVNSSSSSLLFSLTQPILRRAFRQVRLESLTQAERDLLYGVRDFARFRRAFYVDVNGAGGYLGLLAIAQGIKNQEANLISLERNLEEHDELVASNQVAPIARDQVYQQYQQGRLNVVSARQSLDSALDQFKLQLGLPPTLEIKLEDDALDLFELNTPALTDLRQGNEELNLSLLQYVGKGTPRAVLEDALTKLKQQQEELPQFRKGIEERVEQLQKKLEEQSETETADSEEFALQQDLANSLEQTLEAYDEIFEDHLAATQLVEMEMQNPNLGDEKLEVLAESLQLLIGRQFRSLVTDLFVVEAQARIYLIDIVPLRIESDDALTLALENRLDLMNSRAQVMDARRRVEVAADALQSDLDLSAQAELGTDPSKNSPLRFDSSANRYQVGINFDGPLDRYAERNTYRTSQIAYQRSRRNFMASKDNIIAQIRQDIRNLELNRFQFDIDRRQLINLARQVQLAEVNLRNAREADSSVTQDLLNALQGLLRSKNSLISTWISYETSRMVLFRDLDLLFVDETGTWINEFDNPGSTEGRLENLVEEIEDFDPTVGSSRPARSSSPPEPNDFGIDNVVGDDFGAGEGAIAPEPVDLEL